MGDPVRDLIPVQAVDLDRPNVARVYDYWLGGDANWAVDRIFGDQVAAKIPLVRQMAVANRQFLNRTVAYLCRQGVRQFLDIGSGIPTAGNTHEVADEIGTDTRVVYVDHEAVAVAHGEELLDTDGDPSRHAVVEADLRNPDDLWTKATATGVLDPEKPIGLLMFAVLHVAQPGLDGRDLAHEAVDRYRELLVTGSYLAVSHVTTDGVPADVARKFDQVVELYEHSSSRVALRSRDDIGRFMGDFELVEPGMVWLPLWRPQEQTGSFRQQVAFSDPHDSLVWAGVGRKT